MAGVSVPVRIIVCAVEPPLSVMLSARLLSVQLKASWPDWKLPVIETVAPTRFGLSISVTVTPESTAVAGSFSV